MREAETEEVDRMKRSVRQKDEGAMNAVHIIRKKRIDDATHRTRRMIKLPTENTTKDDDEADLMISQESVNHRPIRIVNDTMLARNQVKSRARVKARNIRQKRRNCTRKSINAASTIVIAHKLSTLHLLFL